MSFADRHFLLSQDNWVVGTQDLDEKTPHFFGGKF